MKKLGIIITAYQSERFLLDAINSLKNQTLPVEWKIQFFIGVDGCIECYRILKENSITFFYSQRNVGTYILTNSLLEKSQKENCDMFLRFDSDDIATENFLYYGIQHAEKKEFVRNFLMFTDEYLNPIDRKVHRGVGSVFFTRYVLNNLGGYKHYRVGCDNDFRRRSEKINLKGIVRSNKPLFLRRKHNKSLTGNANTGHNSKYRNEIENLMQKERAFTNKVKLTPKTAILSYE